MWLSCVYSDIKPTANVPRIEAKGTMMLQWLCTVNLVPLAFLFLSFDNSRSCTPGFKMWLSCISSGTKLSVEVPRSQAEGTVICSNGLRSVSASYLFIPVFWYSGITPRILNVIILCILRHQTISRGPQKSGRRYSNVLVACAMLVPPT